MILGIITVIGVALIAVMHLTARYIKKPASLPTTTDWIDELGTRDYRPMLRLLDQNDLEVLKTQPGYTASLGKTFRNKRARLFRQYLRDLETDFIQINGAIRIIMLHSQVDRPDLASLTIQSTVRFAYLKCALGIRSRAFEHGIGNLSGAELLELFDGMRIELRTLVPATGGEMA